MSCRHPQRDSATHAVAGQAHELAGHLRLVGKKVQKAPRVGIDPIGGERSHRREQASALLRVAECGGHIEWLPIAFAVVHIRHQHDIPPAREPVPHRPHHIAGAAGIGVENHRRARLVR
ncbi:Uncharacterised protein [Mycobacteroides abscessus subsp. abscessus]|nr:Uncharacterised protein [Mycobacteroides abscessus subsp. abscessus]